MHEMEEGMRSSGGMVKKKTSSGCLIIKKKVDGTGGIGTSGSRKVLQSKRPRLVLSDSESGDELLEPYRRKIVSGTDKFRNGSVVHKEAILEDKKFGRNGGIESDRKRRLDVFEFDEYDGIDGKRMREDYLHGRFKHTGRSGSERDFENGSSTHAVIDTKQRPYVDGTSRSAVGRREVPSYTGKSRFEMDDDDDDEAQLPISSLRQKFRAPSDEPIRLQGKSGVLKVMVNKKNKMKLPQKFYDHQVEVEYGKGSKSESAIRENVSVECSSYSDLKYPEKAISSFRIKKSEVKQRKISSAGAKAGNSGREDSDTLLKVGPTSMKTQSSLKGIKSQKEAPPAEMVMPIQGKEGKLKRGNGTEKQLLREKIRKMLVDAGWTIDYRPRRNRDYLDAVYINPSGTAYWSIIKAYDAFQKQLEEEDTDKGVTPLPEELLSKLTRQTRKKIEREMKKKRRSKNVKEVASEESAENTDGDKDDEKLNFFRKQKGKLSKRGTQETTYASGDDSSSGHKESLKKQRAEKSSTPANSHVIQARKSRKIGRCTLLVRNCDKRVNSESDRYVPYTGKRTLLSWLIDSGTVHLREKVQYMNRRRTRVMLEGWITKDGIHCGCCSKILTVSKFEIHAGSKLRQPFQNIYLESGVSLLHCQIDAWNRQEEFERSGFHMVDVDGDDPNDDTCGLCGDGGDLICCDGCPSTFHQSCLNIKMLPPGDWHCQNCTCKFCGVAGGDIAHGNGTTGGALLTCIMCERKFHESCSEEMYGLPGDKSAPSSFCGHTCQELFDHIQKLLGVKHEVEAGFSWTLVHRTDLDSDPLHRGFPQRVECNSKLAVALSVMDECFLPIVDRRSGINLIHNVLYNCGSNFSRLNYSGFYAAILERGDEIISAASIRIHGTQLAEMPFIGTRHIYRRQGMCRRLFSAIESVLRSLKVEKLIIPAIAEHMHTWTVVFGFNSLEESHKQEMRSMNMLVFPGTDMLQKLLMDLRTSDAKLTANSDLGRKTDPDSLAGHDLNDNASLHNVYEMSSKVAALDSSLNVPAIPFNDDECLDSTSDLRSEPKLPVFDEKAFLHSHSVQKLTESSADLKCLNSSDANEVLLQMENCVLDPSVEGKSQIVDDIDDANVEVSVDEPVHDLGETSTMETFEEIKRVQNPPSECTGYRTNQPSKQLCSDFSPHSSVNAEQELHAASEAPSEVKGEPLQADIQSSSESYWHDAHHAEVVTTCAGPFVDSISRISSLDATVNVSENQDPVSVTFRHSTDQCVQLAPDMNLPDALELESKLNAASRVSDSRAVPVDGNARSTALIDSAEVCETNSEVACIKPVLDTFDGISRSSANGEMNGMDVNMMECNSDLNHDSTFLVENEFHVASEITPIAEVVPAKNNIQSAAVCGQADTCVKPVSVYSGEIPAQSQDIKEKQDPSIPDSDESSMQLNSTVSKQNPLKVENNLHVASEVALVGNNVSFNAEDGVTNENVINAFVEPDLLSSVNISGENATVESK